MTASVRHAQAQAIGTEIRVRGRVQGVGFRPTVWRFARELGMNGEVLNDSHGLVIRVTGTDEEVLRLVGRLRGEPPPLARIDSIETRRVLVAPLQEFRIAASAPGDARTEVAPDAAACAACMQEVLDPRSRRYRYALTNCTHCGPRFSIVKGIPFDRGATTMADFAMCRDCAAEYQDPRDRRFHAEAIACPACGPQVRLLRLRSGSGHAQPQAPRDPIDAVHDLLLAGEVIALKGLGGYQLACDATNEAAVSRLRGAKLREAKPFALMARDLDVIRRFCDVDAQEERELASAEGPIVLLRAAGSERVAASVAPGLGTLGFMLPTTPLHALALRRIATPVVMTSGNLSGEPQVTDDRQVAARLGGLASHAVLHDRPIACRIDDSVVRVIGGIPRTLRRARGFAPAPIALPQGFHSAAGVLAYGGELKSTFCMVRDGQAILSQHQGDLEDAATYDEFRRNIALYSALFDHSPLALAADCHPEYLSSKLARERAREDGLRLVEVQHHHAHVAACLAENGRGLDAAPVLGIVLDGLGWGADATLWGGEFLLADYRRAERIATFKPVAMPGAAQAVREPWRNLYAHLAAAMGWAEFAMNFSQLEVFRYLAGKPRPVLDAMLRNRLNTPLASSCGRLFDAVAAALGICRESQAYEGEAACRLEAMVDERTLREEGDALAYPFTMPDLGKGGLPYIEPLAMWRALLGDLILKTPAPVMAARFHKGLACAIARLARRLAAGAPGTPQRFDTVALSGGCFQNAVLFGEVATRLEAAGLTVLAHSRVPMNDGGLALGQAVVAAACAMGESSCGSEPTCA